MTHWQDFILSIDSRRDIYIGNDTETTLKFCAEHFIDVASTAIAEQDKFCVALSGGKTPENLFKMLASPTYRSKLDWSKIFLFWSDERCVPPTHSESNYFMAMNAGLASLPIPSEHIFRMPAESSDREEAAETYEKLIKKHTVSEAFDLVALGMGEDGHTASLFPKTHGLHTETEALVIPNFIPQKDTWRMTLTFKCINEARHIAIYVLGKNKASMLKRVFNDPYDPNILPIQEIGSPTHKALWIADRDAAAELSNFIPGK